MFVSLALGILFAAAVSTDARGPALALWYEGPVRYLLTRREEKEFRALHDDAARSEFIRQFWRRRDPIPQTAENEARISFWRRVVEANAAFQDSPLPGWKTDRGKIYILVGPPTDIEELPDYDTREPTIAERGLLRWIYQGTLKGPAFAGTYIVPFVRSNDGSYHLSSSTRLASVTFNPLASYDEEAPDISRIQSTLDYGVADLGTALDQAFLQSPPWQEKDFIDRVTSEAFLGALPMRVSFDYLRASDGSTYAIITCSAPASAFAPRPGSSLLPDVAAIARLSPEGGGEPIDLGEAAFAPAPTNAAVTSELEARAKAPDKGEAETAPADRHLLYEARTPLRPGRYDLYVGLFERVRLQAANLRTSIDVPDLGGPLTLSSIILGRALRPVPEGTGGYQRPFRISDFEIIPVVGQPYHTRETFSAFWQIYTEGPSGPGSGLQVTRQFYRIANGKETAVGKPYVIENASAVQAFTLDLDGWPASRYRFEVAVRDRSGRMAARSAGFTIQ